MSRRERWLLYGALAMFGAMSLFIGTLIWDTAMDVAGEIAAARDAVP